VRRLLDSLMHYILRHSRHWQLMKPGRQARSYQATYLQHTASIAGRGSKVGRGLALRSCMHKAYASASPLLGGALQDGSCKVLLCNQQLVLVNLTLCCCVCCCRAVGVAEAV
jgi:hypothetical protein